jgi:hypothetical protein
MELSMRSMRSILKLKKRVVVVCVGIGGVVTFLAAFKKNVVDLVPNQSRVVLKADKIVQRQNYWMGFDLVPTDSGVDIQEITMKFPKFVGGSEYRGNGKSFNAYTWLLSAFSVDMDGKMPPEKGGWYCDGFVPFLIEADYTKDSERHVARAIYKMRLKRFMQQGLSENIIEFRGFAFDRRVGSSVDLDKELSKTMVCGSLDADGNEIRPR